jgi:hypothetical protein
MRKPEQLKVYLTKSSIAGLENLQANVSPTQDDFIPAACPASAKIVALIYHGFRLSSHEILPQDNLAVFAIRVMDDFFVGVVLSFKASTHLRIANFARTVAAGIEF